MNGGAIALGVLLGLIGLGLLLTCARDQASRRWARVYFAVVGVAGLGECVLLVLVGLGVLR